ncbi:beta galactosidase jelly roll domain-containing protein [candidate division KSB1 bacterium]|nr:beta galactosidase jelly roll domain-containing protein [candidate division KSB1 bacterium]
MQNVTHAVRPEHPRPDFERSDWFNLNGNWQFDFDPQNVGVTEKWYTAEKHQFSQEIIVPFPWESQLSGIQKVDYRGVAWYTREFSLPENWEKKRIFLKFGAVDWEAQVWVNAQLIGQHVGGYSAFEFEITAALQAGQANRITVRAIDYTSPETPVGKQIGWYTPTSGIWQTVYLEARPAMYLDQIHFRPDVDQISVTARVTLQSPNTSKKMKLRIQAEKDLFPLVEQALKLTPGANTLECTWKMVNPQLWSPENPFLYPVRVQLWQANQLVDEVQSYFGMRKISTGRWADQDYESILLNHRPYYLLGALNQAFHPEGIHTYPSDAAIQADVAQAKAFGLNFLRIHIKVDEPRLYYWADKLGLLIMSDMPCFIDYTAAAQANWELTFRDAVQRDFNHPSIFAWCLFNETWGLGMRDQYSPERQAWVRQMVDLGHQLDPTRLVEDNSACFYDHVVTDINSWHFYINDYYHARAHIQEVVRKTYPGSAFNYTPGNRQGTAPLMNSEYGGISCGMGDQDISWCLKYLTNEIRLHPQIVGFLYTELQDIEWEHNGLMDYDRQPKTFGYDELMPNFSTRDILNQDFLVINQPPCRVYRPGETLTAEIYTSHYSEKDGQGTTLHWEFTGENVAGEKRTYETGSQPIPFPEFTVAKVAVLNFTLPMEKCVGTLSCWVMDEQRQVLARNYINVHIFDQPVAPVEWLGSHLCLLHFNPGTAVTTGWEQIFAAPEYRNQKLAATGQGSFQYQLTLPANLQIADITAVELLFEGAARAGAAKVDARFGNPPWSRHKSFDYPQTDATKHPTDVTIQINQQVIETVHYTDDPADSRGVLSHFYEIDPGSYGYLTRVRIPAEKLEALKRLWVQSGTIELIFKVAADAQNPGGFSLYGELSGRYPLAPTVIIK